MATGQTLFTLTEFMGSPPTTLGAVQVLRVGGSTPAESYYVWSFTNTAIRYLDFVYRMPQNYAGGGISCRINWGAATATSGNCVWEIALRRMADDAEDIDTSQTYDYNSVTDAAPSAAGEFTDAVITFTNGTDMDSVVAGDTFILRIRRQTTGNSLSDNAQLKLIEIRET